MAQLSFELQTLEPLTGAFDIIRYFGTLGDPMANADDIQSALDLSDRSFDKAIRRLVTKDYLQMGGNRAYRLTEKGQNAVQELAAYDAESPAKGTGATVDTESLARRLVVALPQTLITGRPAEVIVGFHPSSDGQDLPHPADMVVRLSTVNGEPHTPEDAILELGNESVQHSFQVIAGSPNAMRVRVQVFQLGPNPDDISVSGGVYVDVGVAPSGAPGKLAAFGGSINVTPL